MEAHQAPHPWDSPGKNCGLGSWIPAAAKSRQSCPALCNPIDGSPSGSRPWDSPGKNTGVGCHFLLRYMKVKSESEVTQSCPTLRDPMDCSLPGSSVHGIFQARVLEWGAITFSSWIPSSDQKKGIISFLTLFQDSVMGHVLYMTEILHLNFGIS